jgi:hypothetical protein
MVGSESHGIGVCGIPLLAKDARNGAPTVLVGAGEIKGPGLVPSPSPSLRAGSVSPRNGETRTGYPAKLLPLLLLLPGGVGYQVVGVYAA